MIFGKGGVSKSAFERKREGRGDLQPQISQPLAQWTVVAIKPSVRLDQGLVSLRESELIEAVARGVILVKTRGQWKEFEKRERIMGSE